MREPVRLKTRGDVGASLLRAARREAPPASSRTRAAAVVGATVATATATSQSAAAAIGTTAVATRFMAWKATSAIGALLVTSAVVVATVPRAPARPSELPQPMPTQASMSPVRASHPAISLAPETAPETSGAPTPPTVAPSRSVPGEGKLSRAPLAEEVELLGRVQGALEAGRTADALRLVDAFYATFPQPHLGAEADALRIKALAAAGDKTRARARLVTFRVAHPESPLLEQLESVVGP